MYTSGVKPMKGTGTRWIDHKLMALDRQTGKFWLYCDHLNDIILTTTNSKKTQLQKESLTNLQILKFFFVKKSKNYNLVFQLTTLKLVIDATESNDEDGNVLQNYGLEMVIGEYNNTYQGYTENWSIKIFAINSALKPNPWL